LQYEPLYLNKLSDSFTTSITAFLSILFLLAFPFMAFTQSHNYWTRSFNEESSLLSGAVVGGGSGPSAIYYNPSGISEITKSKFSLNASLFSFDFINIENALGDGIDLHSTSGNIEPRFISYMIKSKRHKNWSFEVATLNNENVKTQLTSSVDEQVDVLTHIPGNERYFAYYQYANHFRDDWIGCGGSVKLNEKFFAGISMFVTIKSLEYTHSLNIDAFSLSDSVLVDNAYVPFYSASSQTFEYLKFSDYRLVWKAGAHYKTENFSVGLSFTTPSIGVYSDGKRVTHQEKQTNITLPETGEPIPDFVMVDYKEKGDVSVSYKTPFSVAAGITYKFNDRKRSLYCTMEYFSAIDPYRLVEAEESPDVAAGMEGNEVVYSEWLTFVSGAKPVFNTAVGYSWTLKENLLLMAGFRTDFNYQKKMDYSPYTESKQVQTLSLDLYHLTCGLSWNIFGQDIITGFQYSVGGYNHQQQLANLSDPVEFNTAEYIALQGTRNNTMNSLYNSVSIYFGASFNFGGEE
jgi:hypothetical protein